MVTANPTEVVTVAVVTYNSAAHVGRLLDSLPAAAGQVPYRVVVVDNGSTDETVALLEARDDCVLVRSSNVGYAAGINAAVREDGGRGPILMLNPDVVLGERSVPAMMSALSSPGIGIVAPRTIEADGTLSPTLRRGPSLGRVGGLSFTGLPAFAERIEDPAQYVNPHVVDWAVGAILLVDRECYDVVGGLDESYFLYSEETDFCLRAGDLGWATLYTPTATGMHVGAGSGEDATTHTMKVLNRVRLYRRRSGAAAAWLYLALMVLVELRRALLGHRPSWIAARALLRPSLRPPQLGVGASILPS